MAKFIRLEKTKTMHEDHPIHSIVNKKSGQSIGQIFWYKPWKKWCVEFKPQTVWSEDCLDDVREFIQGLEKA